MLYEKAVAKTNGSSHSTLNFSDPETVLSTLRDAVEEQAAWKPDEDSHDLFSSGLDSLQTSNLAHEINAADGTDASFEPKDVYSHPTTESLAHLICETCGMNSYSDSRKSRSERMEEVFQKYLADLPITARHPSRPEGITIIHTGSTGSLGSYLLDSLMSLGNVHHIYCVNRSIDARQRQEGLNEERGLLIDFGARVEFLQADFSEPYLRMSLTDYRKLLSSVTLVLHNAWPVNFNLSLDSFTETHVQGVRQLIDFSSRLAHAAHIYFLSTIDTVQRWDTQAPELHPSKSGKVPEEIFDDWSVSQWGMPREPKHISERLLDSAAKMCDEHITVCRLGQIAGPVLKGEKGMWGKQEWFPSYHIHPYISA